MKHKYWRVPGNSYLTKGKKTKVSKLAHRRKLLPDERKVRVVVVDDSLDLDNDKFVNRTFKIVYRIMRCKLPYQKDTS